MKLNLKKTKTAALVAIAISATTCAIAQNGIENVKKLCGCFEVGFKYAETFSPDKNYKYHDREVIDGVTELALPITVTDKKISIQHLLIMGDSVIVKHWREDWVYENDEQWIFKGDKVWEKIKLDKAAVAGKWMQTVWEVDDAPRYQGASGWVGLNGSTVWENTTDAPLPRREYTQRSDYNILRRTNRLVILPNGYNHVQDNVKVLLKDGKEQVIAEEKGLNSYLKLADKECAAGQHYWNVHKGYWLIVENTWEELLSKKTRVELKGKVEGKLLMNILFGLADDWKAGKINATSAPELIKAAIAKFII